MDNEPHAAGIIAEIKSAGLVAGYIISLISVVIIGIVQPLNQSLDNEVLSLLTQIALFSAASLVGLRLSSIVGTAITQVTAIRNSTPQPPQPPPTDTTQ